MDNNPDPRLTNIQERWYESHLTQIEAAKQMGITQPCLNQYLKGRIPLNTDTVIKFATLFDVAPSELDPRIY